MPGTSTRTKPIMVRLPNDVAAAVGRRAAAQGMTASAYLRRIISRRVVEKAKPVPEPIRLAVKPRRKRK